MNTTALLLERLAALIAQSVREDALRHGLKPVHVQVLAYLSRANRYSDLPIAIAEYLGITRGTVSQTLRVLEDKGLIARRPDPRHGRRIHLELTERGEKALEGSWAQRVEAVLESSTLARDLEAGLRALLIGLQRHNGQRAFGICRGCAHFLSEPEGARCGLTGEALAAEQTSKICREWTDPGRAAA